MGDVLDCQMILESDLEYNCRHAAKLTRKRSNSPDTRSTLDVVHQADVSINADAAFCIAAT